MNVFFRIDINIVAMILLGIILLIANKRLDKEDKLNGIFLTVSLIMLFELLFETMTCVINGHSRGILNEISILLHICLFVTSPVLTYLWYVFIYSWIVPSDVISKKRSIMLLIPVIINFIITILSPIYGLVFFINSAGVYKRGPLFIISIAITYFYLICSLIFILKQKNKIMKQEFMPIFIFGIFPVIGGLIQTIFYGVLLMWSSSAFSLVIVYNFLEQRMIHLDILTGAWTRASFYYYISQRARQKSHDQFGVIFIDLDGLKQINDEYGHFEGDCAIKSTVKLIKSVLRKTDIVCRLGGDEFVIILECESKEALEKTIEKINLCFANYNEKSNKDYKLECSFGADIFNTNCNNIEKFLQHLDNLMYHNKKEKKSKVIY